MTDAEPAPLDERVLGSPTTFRFILLLVLFVAGGAGLSAGIAADLATGGGIDNTVGCALASGLNPEAGLEAGWVGSFESSDRAFEACLARFVPNTDWVPLVVVPALLLVAVALYLVLPRWKGRRSRFVAVDKVDLDGQLRRDLEALVAEAGLRVEVEFGVDPGAMTAGAVVFGTRRHPLVRLHSGLLVTHRTNPERFRAVVLHELAHVRNGDVGITYATVAMWRVFLVAVLLPAAASAVYSVLIDRFPAAWHLPAVQVYVLIEEALIVVLVYLTRSDILRTREMHADLTAARRWHVHPDELVDKRSASERSYPARRRALAMAGDLWRTHPSWPARRRALDAPDALFGLGVLPMFATGLIADILAAELDSILNTSVALDLAMDLLTAGLIVAIGGVTVWRAVLYALANGRVAPSGWLAGLSLGGGLAVGELVRGGLGEANGWLPRYPETLAILVVIVMALTVWTAQYAQLRVRTYRGRSPRTAMLIGLIPPWLALTYALSWWQFLSPDQGWLTSPADLLDGLGVPAGHVPPLLIRLYTIIGALPGSDNTFAGLWWVLPLLWLLPLSLSARRRPDGAPNWLHRLAPSTSSVSATPLGLRLVLRAGLLGGLASGVGLLAARFGMDTVRGLEPAGYYAAELTWIVLVITAAMVVTAAVVSARSSAYPLLDALVASGVVALIGTFIAYLQLTVDGCLGPANILVTQQCAVRFTLQADLSEDSIVYVLSAAILGCLAVAALTWAVRTLVRRFRSGAPAATMTDVPMRTRRRRTAVAVLTVTVVVIAADTIQFALAAPAPVTGAEEANVFGPSPAPSASTEQMQIVAWSRYGGFDLVRRIDTVGGTTLPTVITKVANVGNANFQSTMNRLVPPACAQVAALTNDADNYFPIPIAAGQRIWAKVVNALNDATTACHQATHTPEPDSFLAVAADMQNAEYELNNLLRWIGPQDTPGAQAIVASFGEYQSLGYQGLTYRFSAANLSVRPAGTNAEHVPPADRIATLNAATCLAGVPPNTEVVGGHPGWQAWRLVFADGTKVAPARTWSPQDADGPLYPPVSQGEFSITGDCVAGLVPFDIPATEKGAPQEVLFAPSSTPTVLAWSVPPTNRTDIAFLGVAQPMNDGDPAETMTVTGYAAHAAGQKDRVAPGDQIADVTVVACMPDIPPSATAAAQPWALLLSNGVRTSSLGPGPADDSASVEPPQDCRAGSIAFDVPPTDKAYPVEILYDSASTDRYWVLTPPSQ